MHALDCVADRRGYGRKLQRARSEVAVDRCGIEFPLLKGVLALFGARASGEWYSFHGVVYEHWREWK
jgi:hypothetical protein